MGVIILIGWVVGWSVLKSLCHCIILSSIVYGLKKKCGNSIWGKKPIIFACISDEDIVSVCSNSEKRGKLLYIANENYPKPISAGNQECQCLIRTKNYVGIDIHALDIIITRASARNNCFQDIKLQDEDGHRKEITCGHPGLYAFRNIYNNDVRSVTLTLNSRAPKAQGYLWLQAKGKNSQAMCPDQHNTGNNPFTKLKGRQTFKILSSLGKYMY